MSDSKQGGDLPRMVPDRDQIRGRIATASASAIADNAPSPVRGAPSGKGRVPLALWMLVLALVTAVTALGLMAYSQQQSLEMFDQRLQLADERIVSMQRAMTETGESVVMNETAINNQFRAIKSESELQMDEIRKLWDVANQRNREWIETNQQDIAQLQTNLQAQSQASEEAMAALASSRAALTQQIDDIQSDLTDTAAGFAALQDSVSSLNPASIEERLLTLTLAQEDLLVAQGAVSQNQQTLEQQVAELNEVLRSIDAGRLEANRRLVALSDRVGALEGQLSPAGLQ